MKQYGIKMAWWCDDVHADIRGLPMEANFDRRPDHFLTATVNGERFAFRVFRDHWTAFRVMLDDRGHLVSVDPIPKE